MTKPSPLHPEADGCTTMGFVLVCAMSLYGRSQNRPSHVLASADGLL